MHVTRERLLASSILGGAALLAAIATPAAAQTKAATTEVEGIVVTGSRIVRQDYTADSPIVTVGAEALQKTGAVSVEKLLNQLPQFMPSVTDTSNNPSNNGQANIQLRGLGTARTLVLMDGHRITPSNPSGVIDVNTIPIALIENIETITGGASATYGSDALAGVVNFKLKHHFQGIQIDGQYGVTDRRDGQTETVNVTLGGDFDESRGNAVMAFSYGNRAKIFNSARAFSAVSGASGTLPQGVWPVNGATQAAIDSVFAKYGIAPGTVKSPDKLGFNNDGTLFFNGVNYKGPLTPDFATIPLGVGSVPTGNYNTGVLNELQLPQTRYNVFSRVEYDVTPEIKAYGQAYFTNYTADTELAPSPAASSPTGTATGLGSTGFLVPFHTVVNGVTLTNPFIPADLATLLNSRATPTAPFLLNKRFSEVGPRHENDEYNVYQLQLGASGKVGFKDWTWDTMLAYGKMDLLVTQTGNVSHAAVRSLLEAPDGGASQCTGGYNPFGLNPVSASCIAFISRTTKNSETYVQRQAEINFQGGAFDLPAGEVRVAAGADYRRDNFSLTPDSVLSTNDISNLGTVLQNKAPGVVGFNAQNPLNAGTDVYELYGEVLIPILKDLPFVHSLNVNIGGRFSDYSTVGGINTYKADVEWKPIEQFLIRGGYQRAIRAPNINELFAPQGQNFPSIGPAITSTGAPAGLNSGDPCDTRNVYRTGPNGAQVRALCLAQGIPTSLIDTYVYNNTQIQGTTGGNPNLIQETADSYSVGAVWQPHFDMELFRRFSASVDYYNIDIKNAVGTVTASNAVAKCFNADGTSNPTYSNSNFFCSLAVRDPLTGQYGNSQQTNANLAEFKTAGVDFQVDWSFGLGAAGLDDSYGTVGLNVIANMLTEMQVQLLPNGPFRDLKGSIGDQSITNVGNAFAKWKTFTTLNYGIGPFSASFRWRHVDKMIDQSCIGKSTCTAANPPAVDYFDVSGAWKINDNYEISGGVNNIGDKQPPFFTSFIQANTDPSTYDVLGRRYYVGVKARF
ncbi:TonB-dependent receptor domain-containing protein [Phenylobacterium sp.]|uniref:TonB-dependent receptor domain-containing protein n=1 Tax=Phenylobacterium sp. TaxID=1871053 RepID=UPI002DEF9F64|nr:TonB-dependent receptor [Phenylobacterium sp.]